MEQPAQVWVPSIGISQPVLVDCGRNTLNLDPAKIEGAITAKTKAIVPVHMAGQPCDMDEILKIARKHNLRVIEDAAHAIGAHDRPGRQAGTLGDIGCFSFFPSKNLGAFGDGGMAITNDEKLAGILNVLRVHGAEPKYYHKFVGGNFRLDALQASHLACQAKVLETVE